MAVPTRRGAPVITAASDFAELCFHGLAHLPLRGPERLYEPRYLAHVAGLSLEAREPLATDAAQITAMLEAEGAGPRAQWLPRLHHDVASFVATGARELGELGPMDGDPMALRSVRASPAIEWLRADLLLVAEAFAASGEERARIVTAGLATLDAHLSSLTDVALPERIEVCAVLGPRGRAFPDVVMVGAPSSWWCHDAIDAALPAVIAVHERAVLDHRGDYVAREWRALLEVASTLPKTALAEAHRRWLASLDLTLVLDGAVARGWLPETDAADLRQRPDERADRLARAPR